MSAGDSRFSKVLGRYLAVVLSALLPLGALACTTSTTSTKPKATSVAILVIDDFDPRLPHGGPPKDHKVDCAYTGQPTQDVGSHGANGGVLPAGVAHGAVVFAELQAALTGNAGLKHITPVGANYGVTSPWLDAWKSGDTDVALVGLDTAAYETNDVQKTIENALTSMRGHGFDRFVINMSFVVAPCDVQDYLTNATDLLDAYTMLVDSQDDLKEWKSALDELVQRFPKNELTSRLKEELAPVTHVLQDPTLFAALPESVKLRLFYGLFEQDGGFGTGNAPEGAYTQLAGDRLNVWLNTETRSGKVIPVAAAGNGLGFLQPGDERSGPGSDAVVKIRLDFPFAPALWDSVVSVSAVDPEPLDGQSDPRAAYSNSGEVMLDGQLSYPGAELQGTSFAAPRLAYLEALYLLNGGSATCGSEVPPLGYANVDSDQGRHWNNELTDEAARSSQCADFKDRIT